MINRISEVRVLEPFRLWLRFRDGVSGEVDLSDLAGRGVFKEWSNPDAFRRVRIADRGGLEWPEGVDLCPDALYLRLTGKSVEEALSSTRTELRDA